MRLKPDFEAVQNRMLAFRANAPTADWTLSRGAETPASGVLIHGGVIHPGEVRERLAGVRLSGGAFRRTGGHARPGDI